jgi:hypothetical protein
MLNFSLKLIIFGIMTLIIGMSLSYIFMNEPERSKFQHWGTIGLTMFITGVLVQFIYSYVIPKNILSE